MVQPEVERAEMPKQSKEIEGEASLPKGMHIHLYCRVPLTASTCTQKLFSDAFFIITLWIRCIKYHQISLLYNSITIEHSRKLIAQFRRALATIYIWTETLGKQNRSLQPILLP